MAPLCPGENHRESIHKKQKRDETGMQDQPSTSLNGSLAK